MRRTWLVLVFAAVTPFVVADDAKQDARKLTAEKRFKKLAEYCKERRATHVVELLAEWGEFAQLDQQDIVLGMASGIFDDAVDQVRKNRAVGGNMAFPTVSRFGVSADADFERKAGFASAFFVNEYESVQPKKPRLKNREDLPWQQVICGSRSMTAYPNSQGHRTMNG